MKTLGINPVEVRTAIRDGCHDGVFHSLPDASDILHKIHEGIYHGIIDALENEDFRRQIASAIAEALQKK